MRILDRYILKSILAIFICCIFVFLFLFVVIDILGHLEDILKHKLTILLLTQYYLTYLPTIFVQAAPFACLLSTLYTFGKLNHNNEIIAMRSSGLSIFWITKDTLIFATIISLFIFWLNDRIVPLATSLNQKIKMQMQAEGLRKPNRPEIINNLSMYGIKNRLFFVNKFSSLTNTMEGIVILEQDENQNITRKIVASKAIYREGNWKFYQCITYDFDQDTQIINEPMYAEEQNIAIPETPQDFLNQKQLPEAMTITQLDDYIWRLSKSGSPNLIRNFKVDLYQRFTSPFTSLIIVILGVPFALQMRRRATGLASVGLSIVVGFLYYIIDAISIALGKSGVILPALAVTLSHILMLSFGLYLIGNLP
jgi:lipopolysaccharide export system permease protein